MRSREGIFDFFLADMTTSGLEDQDRLDGASNYVIWKARMSFLLEEHALKTYVDSVIVVPADANPLKSTELRW